MVKKLSRFQAKLKEDIFEIKSSSEVYVFADKTKNMSVDTHEKLLKENITVVYSSLNLEAKSIPKKLKLANQVKYLPQSWAYITFKDHKEKFISNPSCRFINPSKSELDKSSKVIIEHLNKRLLIVPKYYQ